MVRSGPAKPGKTVQWTVLSDERRELGRAAGGPICSWTVVPAQWFNLVLICSMS